MDSNTHKIIESAPGCLILMKIKKLIELWLSQHRSQKSAQKCGPVQNQCSSFSWKNTIKSETSTSGKIIVGDENGDYDEHTNYEMGTPKSKS